jgi:FkbM family methyltransferase
VKRPLKPEYLLRPEQAFRRALHGFSRNPPESAVLTLPWGAEIEVATREAIGRAIWNLGLHDLLVSEALSRVTERGALCFDAGANIGQMSGLMATRSAPSGRVLAFEPHPQLFSRLQANMARLQPAGSFSPVDCLPNALGESDGVGFLGWGNDFESNSGTATMSEAKPNRVEVTVRSIDSILGQDYLDVLKIDVEGSEIGVLKGATRALSERRVGFIVLETAGERRDRALSCLKKFGYSVFRLIRSTWRPVLAPDNDVSAAQAFEAPCYVASLDGARLVQIFAAKGWGCLDRPRR